MNPRTTGDYHVIFLSHHPSDNHLCDNNTRWKPLWHGHIMNKNNIPVTKYGTYSDPLVNPMTQRIFFGQIPFI